MPTKKKTPRAHACHCSNELCNADNYLKLIEAELKLAKESNEIKRTKKLDEKTL